MRKLSREWAILLVVLIAAFAARMATFKYSLLALDPFHHFAIGESIAKGNGFPELWGLSNYPSGARITEPPGLYYVSVFLYWMLKPFGISYLSAFKLSSPLFGAGTIIVIYFLVKELFNRKTALYSAVILAFLPGFLYRTYSGFYRGDAFSVFFMVLGFYLFFKSLEGSTKNRLGFAISAGLSFGLMGLVWNGFLFGFVVLSSFVIVYSAVAYLRGGESRPVVLAYVLSAGIGIAMIKYSIMLHPRVENYITDLIKYIYPLTIGVSIFFEGLRYKTEGFSLKNNVYILGFFLLAGVFLAYQFFGEVLKNLYTGYGMVKATGGIMPTIGELKPPTNEALWDKYGIAGILAIPGVFYLLKEKQLRSLVFVLVWLLASAFVMKTALRYTFIASLPIAVAGAFFLCKIEGKFPKKATNLITGAVLVFVVFTGVVFTAEQGPYITPQWVEALEFLESQEEGGIFTWWDYGSWIQGIAGFPTTLDTVAGQNPGRISHTGRILLLKNESKAIAEFEKLKVDYAVIPVDMVGQMTNINFILNIDPGYQYPLFPKTGDVMVVDVPAERYGTNMYVFDIGGDKVVAVEDGGRLGAFNRVYWREGDTLVKKEYNDFSLPTIDRAVYISKNDLLLNDAGINDFLIPIAQELDGTLLTSLIFLDGEGFEGIELLYGNSQVKIYKVSR
jgi:dolichyl-diphosphooligosaccharide--protein glycosyltransferase